jgi:hypothetical protein
MRNLTDDELEGIEKRAELWFRFGDRTALRARDVADLITEVRELHRQRRHLIALYRQQNPEIDAGFDADRYDASTADAELDPP